MDTWQENKLSLLFMSWDNLRLRRDRREHRLKRMAGDGLRLRHSWRHMPRDKLRLRHKAGDMLELNYMARDKLR